MKCVILAGGLGTRLRSVVHDVPKPMADVSGKPFLSYILKFFNDNLNKVEFIISVGYKSSVIKEYFGENFKKSNITYVEEKSPLGTGGALKKILNEIDFNGKSFFLVNGDTFLNVDLNQLQKMHLRTNADVTVCAIRAKERKRFGRLIFDHNTNKISEFQSQKSDINDLCNGGVYLINSGSNFSNYFNCNDEKFSFEADILDLLAKNENIYAFPVNGYFIDIGVPRDYFLACQYFRKD